MLLRITWFCSAPRPLTRRSGQGALILGILSNGMNLLGIGTVYQFIVEGAVLVVAVVLDLTLKGNGLRIKKPHRSR